MTKIRIPGNKCTSSHLYLHYKAIGNCFGSHGKGFCNASIEYETNRLIYLIKKNFRLNK